MGRDLRARVLTLPSDLQWGIYRKYFSTFVVPAIALPHNKCNMINDPPNIKECHIADTFHVVLAAFSDACLYDRFGAQLDITDLSANDRYFVCRELEKAGGQLTVQDGDDGTLAAPRPKGRIVVVTPDWGWETPCLLQHMKIVKTDIPFLPGWTPITRHGLIYSTNEGKIMDVALAYSNLVEKS